MSDVNEQHILSYGKLALVFGCLLVLTVVTITVSRIDFGAVNIWAAILIAATKGSLVLLFFMHVKYEGPVIRYSFLATLLTLAILISFIFWDVSFR